MKFFTIFFIFILSLFIVSCGEVPGDNYPPRFYPPLNKYKLTQSFSSSKRPPHLGVDLKASIGTPVLSSHSGRVIYAGKRLTGYGNVVEVENTYGWTSLYAHLQKIKVKTGQQVTIGDTIGTLGNTGRSTGPHLHYELKYKNKTVNPLDYFLK